jgi:hypothetical protein
MARDQLLHSRHSRECRECLFRSKCNHERPEAVGQPLTVGVCCTAHLPPPLQVWPSAKALLGNRKLGKSCVGVLETKQSNNEKVSE